MLIAPSQGALRFVSQYIRHQKALMTSWENWIKTGSFTPEDAHEAVRIMRAVLDSYEVQIELLLKE